MTLMNKFKYTIPIAFAVLMFSSCGKDSEKLDEVLFGTWNVTNVEGQQYTNGNAGWNLSDNDPEGTITFNENGWGSQDYSFTIFGSTQTFNNNFSWEANESEIRINRLNQPDMIWVRETNENNRQIATYNIVVDADENWDYTLTLEK